MQDEILLIVGYILIGLFVLAIIIPMVYIIVASFMDPVTLQNKGISFDFSKWTATAYPVEVREEESVNRPLAILDGCTDNDWNEYINKLNAYGLEEYFGHLSEIFGFFL